MTKKTAVEIVSYKPEWPEQFQKIKEQLERVFLPEHVISIEHIGSTAVPGLSAKDCIDIQITLPNFDDALLKSVNEQLQTHGFPRLEERIDHRPPLDEHSKEHWQKYFIKNAPVNTKANIHIRMLGMANQAYPLLFRDFLRTHNSIAAAYGETKKRLAESLPDDLNLYSEVKDPVCDIILEEAKNWAEVTGWSQDSNRILNYECYSQIN